MSEKLLEVKNLTKYFKTSRGMLHAVDGISFSIDKGKTLGGQENPDAGNPPQDVPFCV